VRQVTGGLMTRLNISLTFFLSMLISSASI
jgi:hypothetical protein